MVIAPAFRSRESCADATGDKVARRGGANVNRRLRPMNVSSSSHKIQGVRPSTGSRLPGIEGVRAIAACSILVYHTWLYAEPGELPTDLGDRVNHLMPNFMYGVVLFFTLSGFLLYRPFVGAIVRGGDIPSTRQYLRNRALRILPAYWVILFLSAVVLGGVLVRDASDDLVADRVLDPVLLIKSALFLQHLDPDTVATGIGPAWSLAVEVVFYLTLPLLVLLASGLARGWSGRSRRRWAALVPVGLLLAIGLVGKAIAAYAVPASQPYAGWEADWHSVLERSFVCHADLFAFGMALAVVRIDAEDNLLRLPRWWRPGAVATGLFASLLVVRFGEGQLSYSPYNTLVAAICALFLALVVLPTPFHRRGLLTRVLEARTFVAAGLVSYSIFLWQEPLIRWAESMGLTLSGPAVFFVNLAFIAVITGAASTLTYAFVEAPALRLKLGHGRERRAAVGADAQAAP
jgi:peptidoglycan/LPS O-acetylase OafA/YrhL